MMKLVLMFLGWYLILLGALLFGRPPLGKQLADWAMKDKTSRAWALVTAGFGVLFVWAATASRISPFIYVLGGLTMLKGIYLLLAPRAQLVGLVDWWNRLPQLAYRVWGAVALALGGLIVATL